jgi:hypothetical protein
VSNHNSKNVFYHVCQQIEGKVSVLSRCKLFGLPLLSRAHFVRACYVEVSKTCFEDMTWQDVCIKHHACCRAEQVPPTGQRYEPQANVLPPPPPPSASTRRELQRRGLMGTLIQLPRSAFSTGLGLLLGVVGLGAAAIAFLGSRILPAPVMASLQSEAPIHP